MKIRNLFLPSVALGAAFLLMTPKESTGFALLGHSLATGQSDFRVFNNFLDSNSNNNVTPHDNFPGYTGAVMALWKGVVEWSSAPHGDGGGDPHQGILGSGNSSFDPMFNGEATGIGVIGNNIISGLNQSGGSTIAFMQGGSSGWWIRFYDGDKVFADGPGTGIGFNYDLQGVNCHEYGHALGLGHSGSGSATMEGSIGAGNIGERSISADDVAGIQAIYGVANNSGTKPTITSVTNLGGQVHIVGTNFTTNNNQVWFTKLTPGTTGGTGGNPIKISSIVSTNGNTEILLNIPAAAGPGDILVKRNSAGQESTSAAWPFDPFSVAPPAPMVTNVSPTQVPAVVATGTPTVVLTGSGFSTATNLVVNGKLVGDPSTTFTGSWSIDNDNQITFDMPLTGSAGVVPITFDTAGGQGTAQIEIIAPLTPALATADTNLHSSVGLSMAGTAQNGDIVFLDYSGILGATTIPGLFDLEIGGGDLNQIFKAKRWNIGPKFWRRFDTGPLTGLPIGVTIYFETVVLPFANAFDFPWGDSNVIPITIIS